MAGKSSKPIQGPDNPEDALKAENNKLIPGPEDAEGYSGGEFSQNTEAGYGAAGRYPVDVPQMGGRVVILDDEMAQSARFAQEMNRNLPGLIHDQAMTGGPAVREAHGVHPHADYVAENERNARRFNEPYVGQPVMDVQFAPDEADQAQSRFDRMARRHRPSPDGFQPHEEFAKTHPAPGQGGAFTVPSYWDGNLYQVPAVAPGSAQAELDEFTGTNGPDDPQAPPARSPRRYA